MSTPSARDRVAMRGAGADQHAEPRARDEQVEPGGDGQTRRDQHQTVRRVGQSRERDGTGERGGNVHPNRGLAPGDRRRRRSRSGSARTSPALDRDARGRYRRRMTTSSITTPASAAAAAPASTAIRNGAPRAAARRGDERAEHVERPVRQIDDAHDPEHERQPRGEQEDHDPELQAVQAALLDRARVTSGLVSLHGARVDVACVAHDLADAAQLELLRLGVADDFHAVPVLDRILVRAELERAAGRVRSRPCAAPRGTRRPSRGRR